MEEQRNVHKILATYIEYEGKEQAENTGLDVW
jgi:hypothetical protein